MTATSESATSSAAPTLRLRSAAHRRQLRCRRLVRYPYTRHSPITLTIRRSQHRWRSDYLCAKSHHRLPICADRTISHPATCLHGHTRGRPRWVTTPVRSHHEHGEQRRNTLSVNRYTTLVCRQTVDDWLTCRGWSDVALSDGEFSRSGTNAHCAGLGQQDGETVGQSTLFTSGGVITAPTDTCCAARRISHHPVIRGCHYPKLLAVSVWS